jgi:hypothetical protein
MYRISKLLIQNDVTSAVCVVIKFLLLHNWFVNHPIVPTKTLVQQRLFAIT